MDMNIFVHYELGIPHIDEEHRKILELTNFIEEFFMNGEKEKAYEYLMELCAYLPGHMESEEELMEKSEFPFINYHRSMHKEINTNLAKLRQDFFKQYSSYKTFTTALSLAILNHIDQYDRQYVDYFKKWLEQKSDIVCVG